MTTQALNFLWLNLELPAPPDPTDGSIRQPLPEKYIENIRKAGARHPEAQIMLWIDSQRLTEKQFDYLRQAIEKERPNVSLKDLRSLPAYDHESLYNKAETNPKWRNTSQNSLIWRQVDTAKILVSLQGDFDQTFFADLDFAHLDIGSERVQYKLGNNGLFIGSGTENQFWGFNRNRHSFFEEYYTEALKAAYHRRNAYKVLLDKIYDFARKENFKRGFTISLGNDDSCTEHPGSPWRDGSGSEVNPLFVSSEKLASVFEKSSNAPDTLLTHEVIFAAVKNVSP